MGTLTNGEDPDEMQHFIRFYTVKVKRSSEKKYNIFFENYNLTPLDMYCGLSRVYCTKPEGRIH